MKTLLQIIAIALTIGAMTQWLIANKSNGKSEIVLLADSSGGG